MTAFIKLEMQKDNGPVYIKPGEVVSFSKAPEGGSRIVTRQKQVYYVVESLCEIETMITDFFDV